MQHNAQQGTNQDHRIEPRKPHFHELARAQTCGQFFAIAAGDHEAAEAEEEVDRQIAAGQVAGIAMVDHHRNRGDPPQAIQ